MGHGVIRLFVSVMTLGRIPVLDCMVGQQSHGTFELTVLLPSYQRLYFRNANHPIARPSVTTRRQDRSAANVQIRAQEVGTEKEADRRFFARLSSEYDSSSILVFRRSHLFDGQTVTKETAAFQLCDITDPMLKEMIEDPDDLREECNVGSTTSGSGHRLI
jgi:hypothetical protein